MTRTSFHAAAWAGAVAVSGALLLAEPPKQPNTSQTVPGHAAGASVPVAVSPLKPKWAPYPTPGPITGLSAKTWQGTGYIFDWGVENTGTQTSQPTQLILTCTVAGGKTWPAGQAEYLKDRPCTCNTQTFYVPEIPAHLTYGFGYPKGLRFQTYQGTDWVTCSDRDYPHAVVTASVGLSRVTVPLCK